MGYPPGYQDPVTDGSDKQYETIIIPARREALGRAASTWLAHFTPDAAASEHPDRTGGAVNHSDVAWLIGCSALTACVAIVCFTAWLVNR